MMAMLSARTATDRAAFVLPVLSNGTRLLDVGCGPGSITLGLARAVAPDGRVTAVDIESIRIEIARQSAANAGITNAAFEVARADELPFEAASFDVVFSHALFEHLAAPPAVLAEMRRVLRPEGVVAICSSDWSGARIEPETEDVGRAMRAHYALRRRAGANPFAGARLREWISGAGFSVTHVGADLKVDMSYGNLALHVAAGIRAALSERGPRDPGLEDAAAAAMRWGASGVSGIALQRWVHVLARR